nr:MAG TPA: hypothetical protein [Caudoviricetes sp.]
MFILSRNIINIMFLSFFLTIDNIAIFTFYVVIFGYIILFIISIGNYFFLSKIYRSR